MQVLSSDVQPALLFGDQHLAVFQRKPADLPVQNRLQSDLAADALDLGLGNIGGPIRRDDEVDFRLSDHGGGDIDILLQE